MCPALAGWVGARCSRYWRGRLVRVVAFRWSYLYLLFISGLLAPSPRNDEEFLPSDDESPVVGSKFYDEDQFRDEMVIPV